MELIAANADGKTATVTGVAVGECDLFAKGDADLGGGERLIETERLHLRVVAPEAVRGVLEEIPA